MSRPLPLPRVSRRRFFAAVLLVTLLVAGGLSYLASAHPDGLEHVAATTGFGDTARDSAAAGSPFADYGTQGVDDPWLSGAVAGVVGVAVVLLLAGGLALAVRRRDPEQD
ncbi:PDGLE domain-containing protein [Nocardioides zeae]